MLQEKPWKIGDLLQWTTDFLQRNGSESPRLDAEILLAHARGSQRIDLYTAYDETADQSLREVFRQYVRQRAEGIPVAYLVGHREFYSLNFEVTRDVLIPRPETEHVVVVLHDWAKSYARGNELLIADVGTGSGVLAVCAAKQLPSSQVVATDISPAALEVARRNADQHQVSGQIEFLESDLLSVVEDRRFDAIVSNPPYVSSSEYLELPRSARDYEPKIALHAGPRGTEVIERLVAQAISLLHSGGLLSIEVSPMIADEVTAMLIAADVFEVRPTVCDLAGHPRVVHAVRRKEGS